MTMTLKDIFKKFEDEVVRLMVRNKEYIAANNGLGWNVDFTDLTRLSAVRNFSLVKSFIKAQPLENQRDLWNTTVDLLNDSVVIDMEIREELLVDCFKELENLNNTILQLHTQKNTTVEGNSEKANKPDTTVEGNSEKIEESEKKGTGKKGTGKKGTEKKGTGKVKPSVKPFNWQGEQTQLVYLIEQLYEHGFLSPISQAEKHRLTAQHFTVKGKSLNQKNLAKTKQSYLNNKGGKPKRGEEIKQIISDAEKAKSKQNLNKTLDNPRQP
jgi:hypothetical protein